mmetsp:Transcript_46491/g.34146  ORF Transcript_46491/g.34146 Transcript_46491/m.34146 type:complete len:91 (-) Transcript_46491:627-899(-)
MFNLDKQSNLFWFNGYTFESNIKFELIGVLMGIAIYNQVLLDLNMPLACYKKLLGLHPTLEDLEELSPSLAASLKYILDCKDPDLEQTLY